MSESEHTDIGSTDLHDVDRLLRVGVAYLRAKACSARPAIVSRGLSHCCEN